MYRCFLVDHKTLFIHDIGIIKRSRFEDTKLLHLFKPTVERLERLRLCENELLGR